MTALYIANPTNQQQLIHYRLDYDKKGEPESRRQFQPAKQQQFAPGTQAVLGSRDMHMTQIDDIVEQLRPYGLVASMDVGRLPRDAKVPYIFNVDKPVPADVIRTVQFHNSNVKTEEGRLRRQKAAVATNETVQQAVQNQFMEMGIDAAPADTTTVSFEQDEQTEMGEKRIEEGFEIVPEGKVGPKSGKPAEVKRGRGRPRINR